MMLKFIDITELGKSRVYGFMNVITNRYYQLDSSLNQNHMECLHIF